MEKTVNIGVIGCGGMGMSLLRKLLACDQRLRVTALFDPDSRSIAKARAELGDSPKVCADYHEIVSMPDIQWVMIASWNSRHCEQVVAAFEAGKHVFCQKPLALNLDECLRMLDAWQRSGKLFNIGFTLRYSPHYRKIKQLIADGNIGSLIRRKGVSPRIWVLTEAGWMSRVVGCQGNYAWNMKGWRIRLRQGFGGHVM